MGFIPTVNGSGGFTATVNGQSALLAGMSTVGIKGDTGPAGANGSPGVVAATAPITYTAGTQTVGMDTSYFLRSPAVAGTDGQIVSWDAATSRPLWIDNAARTLFATVRNETGATLTKGTVVYISGASGNKPLVSKAQANTDANSAQTFAVLSVDIPNNQNGTAIVAGELTKLDTSAYSEGAALYLSPTVAGGYTTTKPSAPNHLVYIATVVRSHATQGIIEVRIQNGYELEELHNVAISGLADKNLLAYDSATSLWKNRTASALDLATMTWATAHFAPAGWNPFDQTLNTGDTVKFGELRFNSPASYALVNYLGMRPFSSAHGDFGIYYKGDKIEFADATQQTTAFIPANYLAKADNLSGLASASTARTNLGLGTMAVEMASDYLTKAGNLSGLSSASTARTNLGLGTAATASTTDFAAAVHTHTASQISDSTTAGRALLTAADAAAQRTSLGLGTMATETAANYALLASPTFTGDPKAPTPATSDNDTSIATTAFVNAYCPAASTSTAGKVQLATDAQVRNGSSTTAVATASQTNSVRYTGNTSEVDLTPFAWLSTFSTWTGTRNRLLFPIIGTTAAGSGIWAIEFQQANLGANSSGIDWSKRVTLTARLTVNQSTFSSNNIYRGLLGKLQNNVIGDLSAHGVGVRLLYGNALELQVHNGTTLTNVTSSFTPTTGTVFEYRVESDGTGNVTLFVNGSQVATTSAGPTTNSGSVRYNTTHELVSATTNTIAPSANISITKVEFGR